MCPCFKFMLSSNLIFAKVVELMRPRKQHSIGFSTSYARGQRLVGQNILLNNCAKIFCNLRCSLSQHRLYCSLVWFISFRIHFIDKMLKYEWYHWSRAGDANYERESPWYSAVIVQSLSPCQHKSREVRSFK